MEIIQSSGLAIYLRGTTLHLPEFAAGISHLLIGFGVISLFFLGGWKQCQFAENLVQTGGGHSALARSHSSFPWVRRIMPPGGAGSLGCGCGHAHSSHRCRRQCQKRASHRWYGQPGRRSPGTLSYHGKAENSQWYLRPPSRPAPVLQPPRVRHSTSNSGPAAQWMAPSTPPPPSRLFLTVLTIASTFIVVISFRTICRGMTTSSHLIGSSYRKWDCLAIEQRMGSVFLDTQHLLDHFKVLGHCVPGHLSPLGDGTVIRLVGVNFHILPDLPLLLGEFLR